MIKNLIVTFASITLLIAAKIDMGLIGSWFIIAALSALVFTELFFIRITMINVYADAITENKFLLFFLKQRVMNVVLSLIVALYFGFYLFVHVNLIPYSELGFFLFAGLVLSVLLAPAKSSAESVTKKEPAKAFARMALIFIVVLLAVLLDGAYSAFFAPLDTRILKAFAVDIPLYVIEDVEHSYTYLQHLLRTLTYVEYNVQSMTLSDKAGVWFEYVRFLLLLSPTPYIAYALIFLSLSSIREFKVVTDR